MKYIMAHDMGTSSDKAVLIDFKGNIVASKAVPYPTYYPAPAFVEQEPEEYWEAVCLASRTIVEETGIDPKDVEGVIFSTQAMGIIPIDKNGRVLHRNITWVDGRAEKQAQTLMKKVGGKRIFTLVSGTPIMGKDVVSKIQWLKEERPDVYNNTKYFLDVNGYLKYKCTGEMVAELTQAAAIGSGMNGDGEIHIYLGTSAWVAASSKNKTKFKHGAAAIQSADPEMNLICGITEAAGSNIQWICDQFFSNEQKELGDGIYAYMDKVIESIPAGSDHLICTPWMLGERCPVSSTTTRATLWNVTPNHTREHIMKALYEGIGYNLRWILENFRKDYKFHCRQFRIIGGGALDDAWMQIIADITGSEFAIVQNPRNAGALGAAIIALIGLGELGSFAEAKNFVVESKTYRPNPQNKYIYDELFKSYKQIYYSLEKTYRQANSRRFEGDEE